MNGSQEGQETAGADVGPRAPTDPPPGDSPSQLSWLDLMVLALLIGSFAALLSYLGQLRYENFFTGNWDLGINQQLLWTTAHGRLLYETGDAEFYNVRSFLQVHSTYVAVLVAPIYAVAATPTTLFAVQSVVFGASVIPLYLIARRELQSKTLLFLVLGLYLISFPVVSALLYDFHWESFIPLEYLSFFYLYRQRRYLWSIVPLLFGLTTLEVFPFLIGGVSLLVLVERIDARGLRPRALLHDADTRRAIELLVGMGVAYVVIRVLEYLVIPGLAGGTTTAGGVAGGISGPFAFNATLVSLGLSATYWALLLAAFAFLPLFAPRYLILTIPWFVYSVFLTPFFASQFGNQYALVAVATLSVALVYGAARVERTGLGTANKTIDITALAIAGVVLVVAGTYWSVDLLSRNLPIPLLVIVGLLPIAVIGVVVAQAHGTRNPKPADEPRSPWNQRPIRMTVFGGILVGFVAFNIVMSPMNTANFGATQYPGYLLRYTPNPASKEMGWVTAQIPGNSVVLASDFLFPYVANNPNAWAMPWFPLIPGQPPLYFPFGPSNLPRYVLIDESDWSNFPCWLTSAMLNSSVYGLVAYVYSTNYLGTISLYREGYTGAPQARYVDVPPSVRYYTDLNLTIGPSGYVATNASSKFGTVISSVPVSSPELAGPPYLGTDVCNELGVPSRSTNVATASSIWYGPYVYLPAGAYLITANLTASLLPGGNASLPILTMTGGPYFAPPLYEISVNASQTSSSGWTDVTWAIDLTVAYPLSEFRGYLDYYNGVPNGRVTLNYIEVAG